MRKIVLVRVDKGVCAIHGLRPTIPVRSISRSTILVLPPARLPPKISLPRQWDTEEPA